MTSDQQAICQKEHGLKIHGAVREKEGGLEPRLPGEVQRGASLFKQRREAPAAGDGWSHKKEYTTPIEMDEIWLLRITIVYQHHHRPH